MACSDSSSEPDGTSEGTTDAQSDAQSDATIADTGTGPSTIGDDTADSTNDGSSDATADTTSGEAVPEPWCGFVGTGPRVLEGPESYDLLQVTAHPGAPIALPLWYYNDGGGNGVRAAVYEIATATWGDTVTLDESGAVEIAIDPIGSAGNPTGAVDVEGNAIVVSSDNLVDPSVRVHRYDAAAASWTTSILSGAFTTIRTVGVTVDADGDAVLIAQNELQEGVSTIVQWFYDVATDTWSAPEEIGPIENYGVWVQWAQDRNSGDAAFFLEAMTGVLQLRHRSAATGEWTMQDVDFPGQPLAYPNAVVSIGDDRFVAIATSGDFDLDTESITGFVFEDGAWQPGFALDEFAHVSNLSVSSDANGRMLATWDAHPTSIRARSYDASAGWSPLHVVNTGQEGVDAIALVTHTLDDGGFVVGWSQYGNSQRTYVRRNDADGWSPIVEVDPD